MNDVGEMTGGSKYSSGMARIWRLATKELRETLRDRRTISTLILMPLLVYPILSLVFQNFLISSLGKNLPRDREFAYSFVFTTNVSEAEARTLLMGISQRISSFDAEVEKARADEPEVWKTNEDLDYRIVPKPKKFDIPLGKNNWLYLAQNHRENIVQIVAQGDVDAGVELEINRATRRFERFRIVERDDSLSAEAGAYIRNRFEKFNRIFSEKNLASHGIRTPISEADVSKIELENIASTGGTIASLIPLALVLMTITGAVYPAIDLTAGERERGTLETLMAAPVPRMGILFAKFIAVVTVAVLTAILNLVGMTIVMWVFQLDKMLPGGGLTVGIIFKVFLLLVLFAAFFAACLLMVTCFARSFKEAQAYLVPIILLSLGPGLLAMSPSIELSGLTAVTPMMNLLVLARDVMQGGVQLAPAVIAVVSTLVYAFVALSIAARMFGADSILYAQEAGLASFLARPRKSSAIVPIVSALLCLAMLLPVNMVSIGVLGRMGPQLQDNFSMFCLLMGCFTVVSFFAIPALVAWINRVDFRSGFGLGGTSIAFFAAAIILGVSLWPIVMLMVEGTYALYGMIAGDAASAIRRDMLVELSGEQVERFRLVPPLLIAICFSIIPAFCEEWFFRGMLLRAFAKEWKAAHAILATSILFGVFHILSNSAISLDRFLPTMLIGLLLGYLAWKSDSIWPGVTLHALHNAMVVFLGYYQKSLSEFSWFPAESENVPWSWGVVAMVIAAVGITIIVKARRSDSGTAPAVQPVSGNL